MKRIYRLYREEGLIVRRLKRKHIIRERCADRHLTAPNQEWALDFVSDAVDLNIVDGTAINSSAMFNNGTETDNADAFVTAVKKKGIRWGGDFNDTDPVHFDDFVKPSGEDYDMIFFFAQHCYDDDHRMRVVS